MELSFPAFIYTIGWCDSAGNCIVLKASEFAPATSAVMKNIMKMHSSKNIFFMRRRRCGCNSADDEAF
jgi:hypothetical protein